MAELVRGRLEGLGPTTIDEIAASLGISNEDASVALIYLEREGFVLRGQFAEASSMEYCERRILARIQRYTLDKLRQQIDPVSAADFMRFLFAWQHVEPDYQLDGSMALVVVLDQLQGFHVPAAAWESQVLASRLRNYDPGWLDRLCLSGDLVWGRILQPASNGIRHRGNLWSVPITLIFRDLLSGWLSVRQVVNGDGSLTLSAASSEIVEFLAQRGPSFFSELVAHTRLLPAQVERTLSELVGQGLVTGDGFDGLRTLMAPASRRRPSLRQRTKGARLTGHANGVAASGRWSLFNAHPDGSAHSDEHDERVARQLLQRYGIVFRSLLVREEGLPPWRGLLRVYRRLEARGEVRGGRFVAGFSGEQFALPEAVQQVWALRRARPSGALISVSASDPLNLAGITSPGPRVPSIASNRVVYRDGIPIAAWVGGAPLSLVPSIQTLESAVQGALGGRASAQTR